MSELIDEIVLEIKTMRQLIEYCKENPEYEKFLDMPFTVQAHIDDEGHWDNSPDIRFSEDHGELILEAHIKHVKIDHRDYEERVHIQHIPDELKDLVNIRNTVDQPRFERKEKEITYRDGETGMEIEDSFEWEFPPEEIIEEVRKIRAWMSENFLKDPGGRGFEDDEFVMKTGHSFEYIHKYEREKEED